MAARKNPAEERVLVHCYRLMDALDEAINASDDAGLAEDFDLARRFLDRTLKTTLESSLPVNTPALRRRWAQEEAAELGLSAVS